MPLPSAGIPLFWNSKFWDAQGLEKSADTPGAPHIFWQQIGEKFTSGYVGFFGGFNPLEIECDNSIGIFKDLLIESEAFAFSQKLNSMEIRMPPLGYFPKFDLSIYKILQGQSWKPIREEVFSFLEPGAELSKVMRKNRIYDIGWWKKQNPEYRHGNEYLRDAYRIINENTVVRNRKNSLNPELLDKLAKFVPDHIEAHVLILEEEIIAAAITLRVTTELVHIYKWANNPSVEQSHPSALPLLLEFIYHGGLIKVTDLVCLGTSSDNGFVNRGLLEFKNSLGFRNCQRLVMEKKMDH